MLTATVLRTEGLTPSVVRVTFCVPGFVSTGHADEWVHAVPDVPVPLLALKLASPL